MLKKFYSISYNSHIIFVKQNFKWSFIKSKYRNQISSKSKNIINNVPLYLLCSKWNLTSPTTLTEATPPFSHSRHEVLRWHHFFHQRTSRINKSYLLSCIFFMPSLILLQWKLFSFAYFFPLPFMFLTLSPPYWENHVFSFLFNSQQSLWDLVVMG